MEKKIGESVFRKAVGRKLRRLRNNKGYPLDCDELSKIASRNTLLYIEKGQAKVNLFTFVSLCEVYGVSAPNVLSTVKAELEMQCRDYKSKP